MSIPYAYCVEAGKVINIFEAREKYFEQEEPRRRLKFLCPDTACREECGPEIQGINYDKIPGIDEIVQRPHFRFKPHSMHSRTCVWAEMAEAFKEIEEDAVGISYSNLKKTDIINVFSPLGEENDADNEGDDTGVLNFISGLPTKGERIAACKDYLRRNINKSSRLHEVVRCFESMNDDERRITMLRIGDMKERSYRQYFSLSRFCSPDAFYPRIYHGRANVYLWRTGYSIRFSRKAKQDDGVECSVAVFIPLEKLRRFRGGKLLKVTLEAAREIGGNSVTCYVFGRVERSTKDGKLTDKIDIHVDSLQSLVVTLIENGE